MLHFYGIILNSSVMLADEEKKNLMKKKEITRS